jgi:hypothetical protein
MHRVVFNDFLELMQDKPSPLTWISQGLDAGIMEGPAAELLYR